MPESPSLLDVRVQSETNPETVKRAGELVLCSGRSGTWAAASSAGGADLARTQAAFHLVERAGHQCWSTRKDGFGQSLCLVCWWLR
jgi:hypothetical protein